MYEFALVVCLFAAALLYSSVGHGGASAYLAAMALFSVAPVEMRPAALVMNICVAAIGTARFYRAGCFSWSLFWPFALASVPLAFVGGAITLPGVIYKQAVGVLLLLAAYQLARQATTETTRQVTTPVALLCGAGIGLLSGLTGTGGGIFLSPLLALAGWAPMKTIAGVSAAFVLVNSIAGIIGVLAVGTPLPSRLSYWVAAAVAGGLIGSHFGSSRLGSPTLRRLLAAVLVVAGCKLILA